MKLFLVSAANNEYVCADDNVLPHVRVLVANRAAPGLWETFYAVGIEWSQDELKALALQLQPLLVPPTPTPGPTPPPQTTDPSQVPFQVYAENNPAWDITNKIGCCAFTEECARRMHALDPNWGHIRKSGSQEQCAGTQPQPHAVDAVFNKATNQAKDIIVQSGASNAQPAWNFTNPPALSEWVAPV